MKKQLAIVLFHGFVSLSCTTVLASDSADGKVYPAFMCLEKGKETGDFDRSIYRITRSKSSGSGILLCPIIRDKVASGGFGRDTSDRGLLGGAVSGPTGFRIKVRTFRTDAGPSIRLTLHSRAYDGSSISKETKYAKVGKQTTEIFTKSKANSGYYLLEVEMGINGTTTTNGYAKLHSYEVIE